MDLDYKDSASKPNKKDLSILFKGRDTKNEGELFLVDHNNLAIRSVFNDVDDVKIKSTIEKATKHKLKFKESVPEYAKISPFKDWLGTKVYTEIDGIPAQKYNVKCIFKVLQTKWFKTDKKVLENEKQVVYDRLIDWYEDYIRYVIDNKLYIGALKDEENEADPSSQFYHLSSNPTQFIQENNGNPFTEKDEILDK